MDPYAAQTYPPPPAAQIPPPNQDPYLYNQPQPYPYYPPQIPQQQYPNPNPVYPQHPEQEPPPIHPPGVPVQNDPNQIAAYQHGYAQPQPHYDPYYQQQPPLSYADAGVVPQGQQQWQPPQGQPEFGLTAVYPPNGQGQSNGPGRGAGRGSSRGGGSSFQGRGRGRGRFGKIPTAPKPQAMAWCELCRVDCNTLEILENHKNGKKHNKNLKIQEDLQKLAAKKLRNHRFPLPPESEPQQPNGLKRKIDNRKAVESVKKPKEIVPFICEMCNVRCESASTFDAHLKGKKHVFNLQRFQEQQASLGQAALQALYPALEALYPALLQAVSQNASSSTPLDQQVLQWLQAYLPQTGPAVFPHGPGPVTVPGPGFGAPGLSQEAPKEVVEVVVKEGESKVDEKVGPGSGTGEVEVKGEEPKPEQVQVQEQGQEQEQDAKPEPEPETEAK